MLLHGRIGCIFDTFKKRPERTRRLGERRSSGRFARRPRLIAGKQPVQDTRRKGGSQQ